MHDRELILELLNQVYNSTQKVLRRFEPIKSVNDKENHFRSEDRLKGSRVR